MYIEDKTGKVKKLENDLTNYFAKVRGSESAGKKYAENPFGSASGLYQFTKDTWTGLGYDWKDRFNTKLQQEAAVRFTNSNISYLKKNLGIEPTHADLYGAHFLGAVGYKKLYKTADNRPISDVMSTRAIHDNPFVQGKSVGFVKNWLSKKMSLKPSASENYDYEDESDMSMNLFTDPGANITAPEIGTTKEEIEAQQAKAELLQKQKEKDFLAELQTKQNQATALRQKQEEQQQQIQQQQQQDSGLDSSFYQVPQIELPNYEAIQYEQLQNQIPQEPAYKDGGEIEGEVECTNCGWSWDKSESTEKDMYNCHKCGGQSTGKSVTKVSKYQTGGRSLTFLQPTSEKLPEGYRIPYAEPSSELAMSIGGENGEPAYLIPSFKYGKPLADPIEEFKKTGEHLGGPFKTWQEADEWERTTRHPAVEKKQNIMFPQEQFQEGGNFDHNSARDNWVEKTGLPWSEAKRLGYTDGSRDSNIELLSQLKDKNFKIKSNKKMDTENTNEFFPQVPINPLWDRKPPVTKKSVAAPIRKAKNDTKTVNKLNKENRSPLSNRSGLDIFNDFITGNIGNTQNLQNGVITDKRSNTSYVVEDGVVTRTFPVLTALNPDQNVNNRGVHYLETHPESRGTPVGAYVMDPKADIYGEPGFRINPIPAFGQPAPKSKDVALHVTYDFKNRNPLYSQEAKNRYASYGCVNCRKPDINYLTDRFKKGDTTIVIDSKNRKDAEFLGRKLFSRK
jgi:hypothetical protein